MLNSTKHLKLGFGLIEALVAISILTIGLMTVLTSFPLSLQINREAELASLSSSYARAKLEQLVTTAYDELTAGTLEPRARLASDPADPLYLLERQTVVTLVDGNLNQSVTDVGLKKIVTTVYWPTFRGTKSLSLTSLVAQH